MEIQKLEKVPAPEARITVMVNDAEGKSQTKEVFMSAGMLRLMASYIGDIESVGNFFIDGTLQEMAIVALLEPRTPNGLTSPEKPAGLDAYGISIEDAERLVEWIGRHVTAFFINGVFNYRNSLSEQMKTLRSLIASLDGTQNSAETKPSAGPTDASQAI